MPPIRRWAYHWAFALEYDLGLEYREGSSFKRDTELKGMEEKIEDFQQSKGSENGSEGHVFFSDSHVSSGVLSADGKTVTPLT